MKSLFVHDIIQSCFESHTFFSPFCSLSVFFPSYWDYSCPDQIKLDTNVYPTYPVPLFCLQSHAGYRPLPTCMSHLRMAQAKEKRNPKSDTITRIGTPPPLHPSTPNRKPEARNRTDRQSRTHRQTGSTRPPAPAPNPRPYNDHNDHNEKNDENENNSRPDGRGITTAPGQAGLRE